jgi:holo-ACP synthase/triphosphoribosyl-dephospho-CoA synthase
MFNLEKFLNDREERVFLQQNLQERYKKPLLAVRTNYPGENKLEPIAQEISDIMAEEVEKYFEGKIIHKETLVSLEGKIHIYLIDESVLEIKRATVYIEEGHPLGRCIDLDVYYENGDGISRSVLGYGKRKCLICDEVAFVCARSMKHSHSELKEEIFKKYREFQKYLLERREVSRKLALSSLKAMILEVSSHPAFGLVSPLSSGAHRDMDYFTFVDSSFAIERYFEEMAALGCSYLEVEEIFRRIRYIGMKAEEAMFKATAEINTHKGMVFLMGIVVAAVGKAIYLKQDLKEVEQIIAQMCRDILKDFDLIKEKIELGKKLTHGEKLYLTYGITGVRGVVREGLKIVFEKSLPVLEKGIEEGQHINSVMTQVLLTLMAELEDSTILHRHNFEVLKEVQARAKMILEKGGAYTSLGKNLCVETEIEFIERNISPGGSADLLAVTLFLHSINQN